VASHRTRQLLNTQYCGITQAQTVTENTVLWNHTGPDKLLKTQYCGITLDQTVTEHTVLWHHTGPDNY